MKNLMKKYDLEKYHSGGGCYHFSYEITNVPSCANLWLINGVDKMLEPSFEYPTDEHQNCVFSFSIDDLEQDEYYRVQEYIESLSIFGNIKATDYEIIFYATLKEGIPTMKKLSEEISQLIDRG
tara:strand:- start:51 stop:422 length:372 start_codon:yes stop_codon:yes gene_type:complete